MCVRDRDCDKLCEKPVGVAERVYVFIVTDLEVSLRHLFFNVRQLFTKFPELIVILFPKMSDQ